MKIAFYFCVLIILCWFLMVLMQKYKQNLKVEYVIKPIDNVDLNYYKQDNINIDNKEIDYLSNNIQFLDNELSNLLQTINLQSKINKFNEINELVEQIIYENKLSENHKNLEDEKLENESVKSENLEDENINNENDYYENLEDENLDREILEIALSQNVHDSLVQNETVNRFNDQIIYDVDDNIFDNDIINYAEKTLDLEKFNKFLNIINQIKNRNANIMNCDNKTEIYIINQTWKNINNEDEKNMFISVILDCIDNLFLVCPTGVITRIINFNPLNDKKLISKDILRIEMLNTASKIMQDIEELEDIEDKKEEFKKRLIEQYKKDYKDIDFKFVEEEYHTWIDECF